MCSSLERLLHYNGSCWPTETPQSYRSISTTDHTTPYRRDLQRPRAPEPRLLASNSPSWHAMAPLNTAQCWKIYSAARTRAQISRLALQPWTLFPYHWTERADLLLVFYCGDPACHVLDAATDDL